MCTQSGVYQGHVNKLYKQMCLLEITGDVLCWNYCKINEQKGFFESEVVKK